MNRRDRYRVTCLEYPQRVSAAPHEPRDLHSAAYDERCGDDVDSRQSAVHRTGNEQEHTRQQRQHDRLRDGLRFAAVDQHPLIEALIDGQGGPDKREQQPAGVWD